MLQRYNPHRPAYMVPCPIFAPWFPTSVVWWASDTSTIELYVDNMHMIEAYHCPYHLDGYQHVLHGSRDTRRYACIRDITYIYELYLSVDGACGPHFSSPRCKTCSRPFGASPARSRASTPPPKRLTLDSRALESLTLASPTQCPSFSINLQSSSII